MSVHFHSDGEDTITVYCDFNCGNEIFSKGDEVPNVLHDGVYMGLSNKLFCVSKPFWIIIKDRIVTEIFHQDNSLIVDENNCDQHHDLRRLTRDYLLKAYNIVPTFSVQ